MTNKKVKKILVISLDAFQYDYLEQAKFLKDLALKNSYGQLKTIFGYTGIGAAINTGKYPKDSGIWLEFLYSPENTPFKLLKYFTFLDKGFFSKLTRLMINLIFNFGRYLRGGSYLTSIKFIPFRQLVNFNTSLYKDWGDKDALERKRTKALFDILRERNIKFLYYDWPIKATNNYLHLDWLTKNNDQDKVDKLLRDKDKADFFWLRIWDLDSVTHKFGPNSSETKKCLQKVDYLCQKVYDNFRTNYDVEFLFWSDHGMVEIKELIDFREIIKEINFPYFLDSTLARFWPSDGQTKSELIEKLNRQKGGKILEREDFEKHNLDFYDERYGKVVFALEPGNLIFPNFYNNSFSPKGMHGYDPDLLEQKGIYISSLTKGQKNKEMIEMYDEVLSLLR